MRWHNCRLVRARQGCRAEGERGRQGQVRARPGQGPVPGRFGQSRTPSRAFTARAITPGAPSTSSASDTVPDSDRSAQASTARTPYFGRLSNLMLHECPCAPLYHISPQGTPRRGARRHLLHMRRRLSQVSPLPSFAKSCAPQPNRIRWGGTIDCAARKKEP